MDEKSKRKYNRIKTVVDWLEIKFVLKREIISKWRIVRDWFCSEKGTTNLLWLVYCTIDFRLYNQFWRVDYDVM